MSLFPSDTAKRISDDDRKNRFLASPVSQTNGNGNESSGLNSGNGGAGVPSLRERAASQPPRSGDHATNLFSSPSNMHFIPFGVGSGSPRTTYRSSQLGANSGRTSAGSNSSSGGGAAAPGAQAGTGGTPQPVPIRSSSFSAQSQTQFSSAMRDRAFPSTFEDDESLPFDDTGTAFPSGGVDERFVLPSLSRGRPTYGHDPSRSRSQSLATMPRPPPIGTSSSIAALRTPTMQSWNESLLSSLGSSSLSASNPLNIQGGSRYGEIKPPGGASRYGSLGTFGVSPSRIHASPSSSPLAPGGGGLMPFLGSNGLSTSSATSSRRYHDVSNMSPFVRDVGEILLDSNSGLGGLWAGLPRDEGSGTTSGTTSRRHSVSIVQPRRGGNNIVGFSAPGTADSPFEEQQPATRSHVFQQGSSYYSGVGGSRGTGDGASSTGGGLGRLLLTDEELAADFGLLNVNPSEPPPPSSSSKMHAPSQPSSLPIYGPHSRSPVSMRDTTSPYRGLGITPIGTNGGGSYFQSSIRQQRQQASTPSDDYPGVADSPQRSALGMQFETSQQPQQLYSSEGVKGSPYINTRVAGYAATSSAGPGASPLSPTSATSIGTSPTATRMVNPQQAPFYAHQRRLSDATQGLPAAAAATAAVAGGAGAAAAAGQGAASSSGVLNDLGKGIPLHSVPTSCPLFIVEFKAGRTDLYYLPDSKMDVRVGDLVIVEADRGRDLGKVVNDGITVREVEAWQRQQIEKAQAQAQAQAGMMGMGQDGQPTSPVGGKKEINPKMIIAKAGPQETQCVFLSPYHAKLIYYVCARMLAAKTQDELKALQLCQSKVRAKKLPMEVVDAEYQW